MKNMEIVILGGVAVVGLYFLVQKAAASCTTAPVQKTEGTTDNGCGCR